MIRREADDAFLLIAQHDHAELAGTLGRHVGGMRFLPPEPFDSTIAAIALHDCGWPLHDEQPTLNDRNLPLHVFETPPHIGVEVWQASVDRTAGQDTYAALLVSLHVLSLSGLAMQIYGTAEVTAESQHRKFLLNRFQHNEVERQEQLRQQLGLRTDLPLRQGLAERGADPREDQLIHNFRTLQAMDQLSLSLCCSERPFRTIELSPHPGGGAVSVELHWAGQEHLLLRPWPFDVAQIDLAVPYRRVPAQRYQSEALFHEAYRAARVGVLPLLVAAG
jgi:hypothetical protein